MKAVLLTPLYFGPIDYFKAIIQADKVIWEVEDHYQKQTFRTRQYIYGANGKLLLNIPISHGAKKGEKQLYKNVQIENSEPWQRTHWRALQSAYQSSPFFEHYAPEFQPLFQSPQKSLINFNLSCIAKVLECIDVQKKVSKTSVYKNKYDPDTLWDGRNLTIAKRNLNQPLPCYPQVFQEKYGFLSNLSILDLLFNSGPESRSYLLSL